MKLMFDIETNGLTHTKVWCLAAVDMESGEEFYFSDFDSDYPDVIDGLKLMDQATVIAGHNIIGFDIPALAQHYQWKVTEQKVIDTMLLSQLNDFYRPSLKKASEISRTGTHAMAAWGIAFKQEKHEDPDWSVYSPEMRERCISDVHLNIRMYKYLLNETKMIKQYSPSYAKALELEHNFATAMAEQRQNGWLFDRGSAEKTLRYIDKRMAEIEMVVEPKLKPRTVFLDKEPREVKYLKNGNMDRVSMAWFADKPVESPYRRFKIVPQNLGNNDAVMNLLFEEGWQPTEWNWKRTENGGLKKGPPKLTEDSYESITGELGQLVGEWRTLRSRRGLLEGLTRLCNSDSRVACDPFVIGTNTFRCRHRGIVNIPGAYAVLGRDVRSCFITSPGRKLVSCDSDSNQLRGLCHYLNNADVTDSVVEGKNEEGTDIHSRVASILGVTRPTAKTVTYALLFGAGDAKLAESAGQKGQGTEIKEKLMQAYPGFDEMLARFEGEWEHNAHEHNRGFVLGLDGRRVFTEKRKAFNALLQSFEAVICKEACVQAERMIKTEKLDAKVVCHYHDEVTYDVAEADAKRVGEILEYSFGPHVTQKYNLNVTMGGTSAIGESWYAVH